MNPPECVWENSEPPNHEDHIAGKGENSLQHYNLVHKFVPMSQAVKNPTAKAAVEKECEILEKISAWNMTKVGSKKEVIEEARTSGATVHVASLMDICHLKNAEFEAKNQKYKCRFVLRGDVVKDDSGSNAVFTEQGSSASQMIAAKIMGIIFRLSSYDGHAADAVSTYTQVKEEDAHKLLKKKQNRSVQTFGFVYHDTNDQNHGSVWKTQSFLLSEICMVILWQDCYGKGNLRKSYWNMTGWKIPNWECLSVHRQKGLFLSVHVDDIKVTGKKQNLDPMWKVLNKEVDLVQTNILPWSCILGLHSTTMRNKQGYCEQLQNHVRISNSSGETEKLSFPQNLRISSWSCAIEGHAKKYGERYCELVNKTTQQLYKVSTSCIDDHHFKEEEMKSVGDLSQVCSQIVLKCSFLARIGQSYILWSVNKLARSIKKWVKACGKRLNRLISDIHHTCDYEQYCHVGNTAKQCRLRLFQDSYCAGDVEDSKSTSGRTLCIFESYTFVPTSWMCKKQTAVSQFNRIWN